MEVVESIVDSRSSTSHEEPEKALGKIFSLVVILLLLLWGHDIVIFMFDAFLVRKDKNTSSRKS